MKPLPEALKELIADRGLSQTDVWAAAGLTSSQLSRWATGRRGREFTPKTLATLEQISAALGVTLDYWLEYRLWNIQQIGARHPGLVNEIYDQLVAEARAEDESLLRSRRSKGK